ncbi:MAG: hydrogenase expression/formation protein HypE, partial [Spirochaetes bacterium]|nr:hydrogenase expression/formation protein HypE [Spirochaetota bacterium]
MNNNITLSHGSGGKLSQDLIRNLILKYFKDPELEKLNDSALLKIKQEDIVFTTDSYTVSPLFFPGGDIGKLAITGTVNDLAVCGARPLCLSAGFILEEGLALDTFETIIRSMAREAGRCSVRIVTGDTKVVQKGKGDLVFINTSGIGIKVYRPELNKKGIRKGDVVVINGSMGEHGSVIMGMQKGLDFQIKIKSDCAPVADMILELLNRKVDIKFMRDPTRGGLATCLNEMISNTGYAMTLDESKIPVRKEVKSLCNILGLDPFYLANEGKVVMIISPGDSKKAIQIMKKYDQGKNAGIIGLITDEACDKVLLKTSLGTRRILDVLTGQALPRIC